MIKIEYTEIALYDLNTISEYILYKFLNPISSKKILLKIQMTINSLKVFPYMGVKYKNTSFRVLISKNYLIFYSFQNNIITIHKIINSKINL